MFSKWMFYNTTQVLIYHGALDIICHFPGAQEMLATTNWKGKEEFHKSERKALWLYNEVHIIFFFIGQKPTHAIEYSQWVFLHILSQSKSESFKYI